MAATETSEILQAIREMEAEEREEAAELLGPHLPEPEFSRRQFGGILAAVAGGTLSVQAAMAAINEGVMPAQAADGVVSDIDTLQSGDGSVIDAENALSFDHENVSSATTIGNVTFIYYDSSVAGFTITIPASLEVDGMILYFVDTAGSAASNTVDVTSTNWNVDGAGSKTLDSDNSTYILFSHSGEWRSKLIVDALTTGSIGNGGSPISLSDPFETPNATVEFDVWSVPSSGTISDGNKAALNPNADDFSGAILIYEPSSSVFGFLGIDSASSAVNIVAQNGSNITTSEDNDQTTNVYWDSGNSRFEINNEEGGGRRYRIGGFYD